MGESKFDATFCEPVEFTDGSWVVHGALSKDEAAAEIIEYALNGDCSYLKGVTLEDVRRRLREDWVRFGFGVDEYSGESENMWWLGSKGKRGAKKVWVYY